MNPILKAGMLLLLLAVPVFIFIFLRSFGTNKYTLPVYYQNGVESSLSSCQFEPGQHYIPDFTFTSQEEDIINQGILENNITVVDFFFTSCPNICPKMSDQLSRFQEAFDEKEQINILSFTVDPANDTPEVLKSYADDYQANTGQWYFLTGEKEKIYHLARCGFLLPVEDGDGSPEDFIHSEKLILIDQEKRIRGYYDGTDREDVDRLILEARILLEQ